MDLELVLQRKPHHFSRVRTPGELYGNGVFLMFSVEDTCREIAGQPVASWKLHGATAIPAGRYAVTLEDSPRFGPDTLTINRVDGFEGIRIHAGNDENVSEGCPLVGYELTAEGTIAFGQTRAAVKNLKRAVREALDHGGRVFIDVRNP